MYAIIGLGNPTSKYTGTRHNIGFEVIDELAARMDISVNIKKHKALCGVGIIGTAKVLLAKPQTYMNLSGESVKAIVDFYKLSPAEDIIIIYDDIDLDVGQLRIRTKGSAGGHNGVKSIISQLGTSEFKRIRIGVGANNSKGDLVNHVLGKFQGTDRRIMDNSVEDAASAASVIITENINTAMNKFNSSGKSAE
ncbi:MAG: aminoacyl-tRNA hydrolase [Eubacterium sp.]